ncbi:MAG: hypothetical protein Q7T01_04195 [bacterium]|nr:hypothetical protein [bacterium]
MSHESARSVRLTGVFGNLVVGDDSCLCRLIEISETAIIVQPSPMPKHSNGEVQVQFVLPGSRSLLCSWGEIVQRTVDLKVTVRRTHEPPRIREAIDAFLQQAQQPA